MNDRTSTLREPQLPPPFIPPGLGPGFLGPGMLRLPMPDRGDYSYLLRGGVSNPAVGQLQNYPQANNNQRGPENNNQRENNIQQENNNNQGNGNEGDGNLENRIEDANGEEEEEATAEQNTAQQNNVVWQSIQMLTNAVESLGRRVLDMQNFQYSERARENVMPSEAAAGRLPGGGIAAGQNNSAWPGNTGVAGLPHVWNSGFGYASGGVPMSHPAMQQQGMPQSTIPHPVIQQPVVNRGTVANSFAKPRFNGSLEECHPVEFLRELQSYCHNLGLPPAERLQIALSCLESEAKTWARGFGYLLVDYERFQQHFLEQYWGQRAQRIVRDELMHGTYDYRGGQKMTDYFLTLVAKARYLENAPPERDLVLLLCRHFPRNISYVMHTCVDIASAYSMLQTEDQHNIGRNFGSNRQPQQSWRTRTDDPSLARHNNNNISNNTNGRQTSREVRSTVVEFGEEETVQEEAGNFRTAASIFVGSDELLEQDDHEPDRSEITYRPSPKIDIRIGKVMVSGLIDTGSEINCISQRLFDELVAAGVEMDEFPITKTSIRGAVGKKSSKVASQIYVTIQIKELLFDVVLIIVNDLYCDLILGEMFLHETGAQIRHQSNDVLLRLENQEILVNFSGQQQDQEKVSPVSQISRLKNEDELGMSVLDAENLTNSERESLMALLSEFQDVFSDIPGRTSLYEHEILVTDESPFNMKQYPIPYYYMDQVGEQIKQMEHSGIISRASTQYVNPLVVTPKKSGEVRTCLDARRLNKVLVKDNEKPPEIQRMLQKFEGARFFSTLDLTSSYWQIPIKKDHRKYTGFMFDSRTYVYNVLPFGLSTSAASFSRAMDMVLGTEVLEFVQKYLEDIMVSSATFSEHLEHLRKVFTRIREANMTISVTKSKFAQAKVTFLGHVVGQDGVAIDPEKTSAITNFPKPKDERALKSFLGLVSYVSRFAPNFAAKAKPLYDLLKKNVAWKWDVDQELAFEMVKRLFLEHTMLDYPMPGQPFVVQTDSSYSGIGAVLFQQGENSRIRVLCYASRILKPAETNYTATEIEALAIVWALSKWRQYLMGSRFTVVTDHRALIFLKKCRLLNARLTRWILFLQQFDFELVHCQGKDNVWADVLSRNPEGATDLGGRSTLLTLAKLTSEEQNVRKILKDLNSAQRNDPMLKHLNDVEEGELRETGSYKYLRESGLLFLQHNKRWRLIIPLESTAGILKYFHDHLGHFGVNKTYSRMKRTVYWKGMRKQTKAYVRGCVTCQLAKSANYTLAGTTRSILPNAVNELLSIDLFGPLPSGVAGVRHVLVIIDVFSKFVSLYAIKTPTAKVLWRRMEGHFRMYGLPSAILCDQGSQFTSSYWTQAVQMQGIRLIHTSVRHPQANPVERTMRELSRLCRTYCQHNHKSWSSMLTKFAEWLNGAVHESIGCAPVEIQLGKSPPDAVRNYLPFPKEELSAVDLEQVRTHLKICANRRNRNAAKQTVFFNPGDYVLIKANPISSAVDAVTRKFFFVYEGPYVITKALRQDVFMLQYPLSEKERGMFHISLLKPYNQPTDDNALKAALEKGNLRSQSSEHVEGECRD